MRFSFCISLCAGILIPLFASAQLITVNEPSLNNFFNDLVDDMAADGAALYIGPGEANASPYDELYWDSSDTAWNTGSLSTDLADTNFRLIGTNLDHFFMRGEINIGFIANENWNLNELFVNAYAPGDIGNSNPRESLFDYSDHDGSPSDMPPDTAQLLLADGVIGPVILEFEHVNHSFDPSGSDYQSNELRFDMFRQVIVNEFGGVDDFGDEWLLVISDHSKENDVDHDDGFFYLTGDISPVPEPSHIAVMALLGLGGLLVVRRRLSSRKG